MRRRNSKSTRRSPRCRESSLRRSGKSTGFGTRSRTSPRGSGRSRRKVGDVSLRLSTIEADLALHQRRLNALNALFRVQTQKFVFLKEQYAESVKVLNTRLVDIYESDETSTIDVFLGSSSLQDAVDKVQYLNEIGDAGPAHREPGGRGEGARSRRSERRRRSCAGRCRARPQSSLREPPRRRDVRNELVGARNDLSSTKQQKLQDLSTLTAERAGRSRRRSTRCRPRAPAGGADPRGAGAPPSAGGPTRRRPSSAGLIWPVQRPGDEPVRLALGPHARGHRHRRRLGTPIQAAAAGTVIYCGWESAATATSS